MPAERKTKSLGRGLLQTAVSTLLIVCALTPAHAGVPAFASYDQVASSDLPANVLLKVIARDGKSKQYTDLLPLDGGTVGIANFAKGGLASLYRAMDTQKYFGRSQDEMIGQFSDQCRPAGKAGNDTGWGCYSKPWWREGMARFLASAESMDTQNQAWLSLMRPVIEAALANGWNDRRSLAIALGIANSVGTTGFKTLAAKMNWRPEEVLTAYVGQNAHRQRRQAALDAAFPPGN